MRLSRLFWLSVVGGGSGFWAAQQLASLAPTSFITLTVARLGGLYGTLVFAAGLFAILAAVKHCLSKTSDDRGAWARWVVGLPLLVGMIGVMHGYLALASYYSSLPPELGMPHATVWSTALVGGFFTMIAAIILLVGRRRHQSPTPLTG